MESSLFENELKTALQVDIVSYRHESSGLGFGSGNFYYTIQLTKIFSGEQGYVEKKLSEFFVLNEELKARAYRNIPKLPQKTLLSIKSSEQHEKRKQELLSYLRELIERRDTRNSQELIEFLELDEFASDILIQKPQLISKWNCNHPPCSSQSLLSNVAHCLFLSKHNLFILALNCNTYDKKGKRIKNWSQLQSSRLQVHSFKQLSQVRDSFILKHGDAHLLSHCGSSTQATDQSFEEAKGVQGMSFDNDQNDTSGRTQSVKFSPSQGLGPSQAKEKQLASNGFEFTATSKQGFTRDQTPQFLQQRSQSERAKRTKTYLRESMVESFASGRSYTGSTFANGADVDEEEMTELLLDYQFGPGTKIKAMTYCDELEILSIAFNDGTIRSFHFNIQLEKDAAPDEDDEYYREEESGEKNRKSDSKVILKRTYEQREGSYPINEEQKIMQMRKEQQQQYFQHQDNSDCFSIEITCYSIMQVHKASKPKIYDMQADSQRGLLYSCGEDKRICVVDVNHSRIVEGGVLKTNNSLVKRLALDYNLKRLYAATHEGLLLILNVQLQSSHGCPFVELCIQIIHTMSFPHGLSARKLDYDHNRNIIFCLLKPLIAKPTQQAGDAFHQNSQIVCIQLDQKREKRSSVVDTIHCPQAFANESFTKMAWLSRVQCTLLTASDHGVLRFYDLDTGNKESILFQLAPPQGNQTQGALLDYQSTFLYYFRERNLIFAGARDGRIGVWRLPDMWRSKEIDQIEREFEFSRKQINKLRAASQKKEQSPQKVKAGQI